MKKNKTPVPTWMKKVTIKYERPRVSYTDNSTNTRIPEETKSPQKVSSKIKTEFTEARCSCGGERENCFRCNGTGFYKKEIITNIDECEDRIEKKRIYNIIPFRKNQFSNDQRGGIFGIRESGRFSSNPLREEDE